MKFKKMAVTLMATFALTACDDKPSDAHQQAQQAIDNAKARSEQVMNDSEKLNSKLKQSTTLTAAPKEQKEKKSDMESYSARADALANRVETSKDLRTDRKLGVDIRSFMAEITVDPNVTVKQFNALSAKFDAEKATLAAGIIFRENLGDNKEECQKILQKLPNQPAMMAPIMSMCLNKK